MNRLLSRRLVPALVVVPVLLLAGCATPEAPDLRGRWTPVNRYSEAPQAIPLQQAYLFQASPMDGTLKTMLTRWARDSKRSLSYLHANDYTLHAPVADIRSTNVQEAVAALSAAYAAQGVLVTADQSQIVVRGAVSAPAPAAAGADSAAPGGE